MGILVSYQFSEDRGLQLKWKRFGFHFVANFAKGDPLMHIALVSNGQALAQIEQPFPYQARLHRLYEDLALKRLSDVLISEAMSMPCEVAHG